MERLTTLHEQHIAAGAKMGPFAGFSMPIRYAGDTAEHLHVRQKVGIFDVSHMGEFLVRGPQALPLIQHVCSNDASKLPVGKAQYSTLLNNDGGIVDDLIVYHLEDELYLLVVNASNVDKDWAWINANNPMAADLENISDVSSLLALSGPLAPALLQKITDLPVGDLGYYAALKGSVAGQNNVLVCTTGYTGEKTYELMCRNEQALPIWEALFAAGGEFDLQPAGLAARDTLRLEMGYMLYGNDIDDNTSPLEAGLGWVTRLKKENDFIAADILRKQAADGPKRKLVAFELTEKGIPRRGYEVAIDGKPIGTATSGGYSPSLQKGIGMVYVPIDKANNGQELTVIIRDKHIPARVVATPFLNDTSVREWFPKKAKA